MPRNGSGTYTLSDTIANATTADASELQAILDDIETALTGSLAADGQTAITGQMLGLVSSNPAWSFVADANTGFGSDSADEAWVKAGGTEVVTVVASGAAVTGTLAVTGESNFGADIQPTTTDAGRLGDGAHQWGDLYLATGGIISWDNGAVLATHSGTTLTFNTTALAGLGAITGTAISGTTITASGALSGATAAGAMLASQAEQETGTATNKLVAPGTQHFHPGAAKAWGTFNAAGTLGSVAYNVSGVVKDSVGDWTVSFSTALSTATYSVLLQLMDETNRSFYFVRTRAVGGFTVKLVDINNADLDITGVMSFVVYGDI